MYETPSGKFVSNVSRNEDIVDGLPNDQRPPHEQIPPLQIVNDDFRLQAVGFANLIADLQEELYDLQTRFTVLEARNNVLEARNNVLETRVNVLEARNIVCTCAAKIV